MQVRQPAILRRLTIRLELASTCVFCPSRYVSAHPRTGLRVELFFCKGVRPAALLAPLQPGHDFVFPDDVVRIDSSKADLPLARGARLAYPDDFVGGAPAQSLQRDDLSDFPDPMGCHQPRARSRDVVGATGLRVRCSATGKNLNRDGDVEPSLVPGIVGGRRGSPFGGEMLLR
jgi:hypothetical protein